MLRHSAAPPGAESRLLGAAAKAKAGVLTFSNLCYGRLLQRFPDEKETVTAADCYRYSIAQPGVSACISAPRRRRELAENLEVLGAPPLSAERIESLRVHGRRVHAESRRFDAWVRRARPDAGTAPDLDSLITDATDESRW
jgi:predicted aldo/keto reductase-like oxidoreductase